MSINETSEIWSDYHKEQAEARTKRKESNLAILRASVIPFLCRDDGDVVRVCSPGYPEIIFWPSLNGWRIGNINVDGTAKDLINYLQRRAMR
jgi:hypothetical protein